MTVKIKTVRGPVGFLNERDTIEIGMSHELKINGDSSWVSYKIATRVGQGETADEAHQRALDFLSDKVEEAVKRAVEDVQRMSE